MLSEARKFYDISAEKQINCVTGNTLFQCLSQCLQSENLPPADPRLRPVLKFVVF